MSAAGLVMEAVEVKAGVKLAAVEEAVAAAEDKLANWTATQKAVAMRSALSARTLRSMAVAAKVTRAPLPVPKSRTSMAKPPPRLAERARLCARPDGGRPRTRPTSLGGAPSSNKKASAV